MALAPALKQKLDDLVNAHRVVLFMKGERRAPMCGFSASVVDILEQMRVSYETVNVMSDGAVREGLKEYSQWPTIPQLYVDGKFVGGADIVKEMQLAGELATLFGGMEKLPAATPPSITVTPAAEEALRAFAADESDPLHLEVTLEFRHDLFFGPRGADDIAVTAGALTLFVDARSATRANGVRIDAIKTGEGLAFKIDNPNEPAKVKPLSAKGLKELRDRGAKFELFDVRTDGERATAKIEGARKWDAEARADLDELPKDTMVVLHCHHGMRSRAAAEQLLAAGYTNVFNLEGGIEAWSTDVDPSVPHY